MNTTDIKAIEEIKANARRLSNNRPTEYKATGRLDREGHYGWVAKSREQFQAQLVAEKNALYETLNTSHANRVEEFRKEIAFAMTKQELTRTISDMVAHDQVMAVKAKRDYCNTFDELERAVLSAEARITKANNPIGSNADDLLEEARNVLRKKGVIRMEKMSHDKIEKVNARFAYNIKAFTEMFQNGYRMVTL